MNVHKQTGGFPSSDAQPVDDQPTQTNLRVTGMTCSACVNTIESVIGSLDGIDSVTVSLLTGKTTINHRPTIIGVRKLIEEIESVSLFILIDLTDRSNEFQLGFHASVWKEQDLSNENPFNRELKSIEVYLKIWFVWNWSRLIC